MDKTQIGLTGEYYTLARLSAHGLVATLTLGNTKGIDILVTNQEINKLYKVEVKTTTTRVRSEKLFGDKLFYIWTMSQKHENEKDPNLIYVFIHLEKPNDNPKFFVVPSIDVAKYVKWQHKYWLDTRKIKGNDTTMRKFRISMDDPEKYENNWKLLK